MDKNLEKLFDQYEGNLLNYCLLYTSDAADEGLV